MREGVKLLTIPHISSNPKLYRCFLVPCNSPCNTPIFPAPKPVRSEYPQVQDLRAINEVVAPMHAVVPNPATILSCVPSDASVLMSRVDLQLKASNIHGPVYPRASFTLPQCSQCLMFQLITFTPQGLVDSPVY